MISSITKKSNLLTAGTSDNILLLKVLILLSLLLWSTGFLLPVINQIKNPLVNFILKNIYASVCHQADSKCIETEGRQMFVCARCAGIYFGGLLAAVLSLSIYIPFIRNRLLFISVLPLITDVLLTTFKVYRYSQTLALITGIIFGTILSLVVLNELEKFLKQSSKMGYE